MTTYAISTDGLGEFGKFYSVYDGLNGGSNRIRLDSDEVTS